MTAFTSAQHLGEVLTAYSRPNDERLGEILQSAITHLHAFVEEVGLTRSEWEQGIEFLTAVGHMCTDKRQEFILLSDVLGVSMLVEMINQRGSARATEPTVFGPFHLDDAPERATGESIVVDDDPGPRVVFSGTVRGIDGSPIGAAELDVWQAGTDGLYDIQDPAKSEMHLRGRFRTDTDGTYRFETVRPVAYPIPDDGPAGEMLRSAGRHNWRPAHTHFVVSAPGCRTLTTHVFDASSDFLDSDAVFGVRDSLVVDMSGGEVAYDFVLDPDGSPPPD